MRNRAYLKGKVGKESGKAGKGREKGTEHTQREGAGAHRLHQVDTMKHTTKGAHDTTHSHHFPKICLDFALFGLQNSR